MTPEQVILNMCMTYRHDFGLDRAPGDPPWCSGMTPMEREGLVRTMTQIYNNNIAPYMDFRKEAQ
jgi:hypothetical protein